MAAMAVDIGGAETHIVELTRELRRRGHDVTVVSAGGVYESDLKDCGAEHISAPLNSRSPASMLRSYIILRRVIKRIRPDVVHGHARIPSFLSGLIKKTSGLKFAFVTTAHWVFKVTPATRLLSDWGQRSLAVSEDIKRYLTDNYGFPEKLITLTVNGIDTDKFTPETRGAQIRHELGIPEAAPVILNISRLDKTAGEAANILVKIAPELIEKNPELRIVITGGEVVGAGSGFYDNLLENAAKVNSDAGYKAVILTGARRDIPEIIAASDIFVGVSRAALEAAASAKPVILLGGEGRLGIFNESKTERAIATNLTCRGFDVISDEEIKSDILTILNASTGEKAELGRFGRAFVIKNYSLAKCADDAEYVYKKAIAGMKRVTMCGYYGHGNAGDEVVMRCVRDSVYTAGADEIFVLSRQPKLTGETYGVVGKYRFNPISVYCALRRSDVMVFGGGSLLQDGTSLRSFLYYIWVLKMARFAHTKIMIYANGIGPLHRESSRRSTVRAVKDADTVTLRDSMSRNELISLGVPSAILEVTADPAVAAEAPHMKENRYSEGSCLSDLGGADDIGISADYAVIVPRAEYSSLTGEVVKIAEYLISLGLKIRVAPMQYSDISIAKDITSSINNKHTAELACFAENHPEELISLLAGAEIVISMRLHALIFSACCGTVCAGFDIDPKIKAFLSESGLPSLGTPASTSAETAIPVLRELYFSREKISRKVEVYINEMRKRAARDTELLRLLINNENKQV